MKLNLVLLFVVLLTPVVTSAQSLYCESTPDMEARVLKTLYIKLGNGGTHLITLASVETNKYEFYSTVPIGIGEMEIKERLGNVEMSVAKGKLLVTDLQKHLIAGILIHEGRQYSIRLDKENGQWSFLLYDTYQKETSSGKCR